MTARYSRILRTIPFIILVCLFSLPAFAKYSGGSGTANDPYQIVTADDLILLGESPEDYDKNFILTADIDLDPNLLDGMVFDKAVIAPDTNEATPRYEGIAFTGIFDGDGHTISHLTIKSESFVGLFGYLGSGAEIKDLGIVDVNIAGSGNCVGGLVGYSYGGSVTLCYSTGSVFGSLDVGGLVGSNSGDVANCYSTGAVSGDDGVGGLVGENPGGWITTCYSTGTVNGARGSRSVGGLVGSGTTFTYRVTASFWDKQTSGQTTSAGGTDKTTVQMQDSKTFMAEGWDFVGQPDGPHDIWAEPEGGGYPFLSWQLPPGYGLPRFSGGNGEPNDPYLISTAEDLNSIGHNPRLMRCHFKLTEDLDLKGFYFYPIGDSDFTYNGVFEGSDLKISNLMIRGESFLGLFGYLESGAEIRDLGVVDVNIAGSHCVGGLVGRNGDLNHGGGVLTNCYSTGIVNGSSFVGGLVGYNYGSVIQCYSTGAISGTIYHVGGLVGHNKGVVKQCYSTGTVSGDEGVGGLVAYNDNGSITTSYSSCTVRGNEEVGGLVGRNDFSSINNSYSTGAVSGGLVGGLVGYNDYGSISNCYSTGNVTGIYNVGGLVVYNKDGSINNCYYLATSGPYNGLGIPMTDIQMKHQSSFFGWDFVGETENGEDDIWWIDEGRDYPRLSWELIPGKLNR